MIPDEIRNLPDNPCNEKRIMTTCPDCDGYGIFKGYHLVRFCETCGGSGEVQMTEDEINDLKYNEY